MKSIISMLLFVVCTSSVFANQCNCLNVDTVFLTTYTWGNTPDYYEMKYTYFYDNIGRLVEFQDKMGSMINRTIYRYDQFNTITITYLNDMDSVYQYEKQVTYAHDDVDTVINSRLINGVWVNNYRNIRQYANRDGRSTHQTYFSWENDQWEPQSDTVYTFDNEGRTTFYQLSLRDDSINALKIQSQKYISYNSSGEMAELITKYYSYSSCIIFRYVYNYNEQGKIISQYDYRLYPDSTDWTLTTKHITNYTVENGVGIDSTVETSLITGEITSITVDTMGSNGKVKTHLYTEYINGNPQTPRKDLYTYDCMNNALTMYSQAYSEGEWIYNGCNTYTYFYKVSAPSKVKKGLQLNENIHVSINQGAISIKGLDTYKEALNAEIYDLKGRLIVSQNVDRSRGNICVFSNQKSLTNNMYLVCLRDSKSRQIIWRGSTQIMK